MPRCVLFVADKRQVSIEPTGWTGSGRKATLNPIMQWYAKDFGGSEQAVKEFLAKHSANDEQAKDLRKAERSWRASRRSRSTTGALRRHQSPEWVLLLGHICEKDKRLLYFRF